MVDQELVLRFFAFFYHDFQISKKNISAFLDEMMEELKKKSDVELAEMKVSFETAIERCHRLLAEEAFLKIVNGNEKQKRKSSTLFEVWTVCLGQCTVAEFAALEAAKECVRRKNRQLLKNDTEFLAAITSSTHKLQNVIIRHERVKTLLNGVLQGASHA